MRDEYTLEIEGMNLNIEYDKAKEKEVPTGKRLTAYAMTAVREKTGMNRKDFAQWLGIPYRTISDSEHGERQMPDYVLRLIAYKVRMEFIEKRGE